MKEKGGDRERGSEEVRFEVPSLIGTCPMRRSTSSRGPTDRMSCSVRRFQKTPFG